MEVKKEIHQNNENKNYSNLIPTKFENFYVRFAGKEDADLVVKFIKDLAEHDNELHLVTATKEKIGTYVFEQQKAQVLLGILDGRPIGFALFFERFSTYLGMPCTELADLYIHPSQRGLGYGRALLGYLAELAVEKGHGRLEWWYHDWNEKAIKVYESWGAKPVEYIRVFRLSGEKLREFALESNRE